ncbi:hypothetical protein [Streptomyces sp. NBC_01237]|uniref:hypothetical protein n=1 Tax=Streptomyces sp. NBC_01237 TaxID=2903790 RepID=UPI002DD91AF4|nr:hypothetical protein [Streptomyces sp. NBC_01237]WRZ76540.1 hypothetical protein OG251_35740 [Streptomyces sp. NBC_01237]
MKNAPSAGYTDRIDKAAGVAALNITCAKDLWERTSHADYGGDSFDVANRRKLADAQAQGGLIEIKLTRTHLVDYLGELEQDIRGGFSRTGTTHRWHGACMPPSLRWLTAFRKAFLPGRFRRRWSITRPSRPGRRPRAAPEPAGLRHRRPLLGLQQKGAAALSEDLRMVLAPVDLPEPAARSMGGDTAGTLIA